MPDAIQVRDLIEMLQRIDDKDAYLRLDVLRIFEGRQLHYQGDADTVRKTGERQYTIFGV